jgi:hypothetical protein
MPTLKARNPNLRNSMGVEPAERLVQKADARLADRRQPLPAIQLMQPMPASMKHAPALATPMSLALVFPLNPCSWNSQLLLTTSSL